MNRTTKQEVLSIIRQVANESNFNNQKKLWHAYKLIGKPKHSLLSQHWDLTVMLALGFLCAFFLNSTLN